MSDIKKELPVKLDTANAAPSDAKNDPSELSELEAEDVAGGLLSTNGGCANAYKC
jgi:hypothetical protein